MQIAKVGELSPELVELAKLYLKCVLSAEAASALRMVWERHPSSLRVKELWETVETYLLIERQISIVKGRKGSGEGQRIDSIYDLACGHGLLGVLLAHRYANPDTFPFFHFPFPSDFPVPLHSTLCHNSQWIVVPPQVP